MKKRRIAAAVGVCMAALLFAGCGKKDSDSSTGSVTLAKYDGLEVNASEIVVSDDDVSEQIEYCLEAYAESTKYTSDATVQEGDTVNIDYVGTIEEGVFENGSAQSASLEIGSNTYMDGFEDGLIGAAIGETVTLNLTFDEDDFSGQTTTVEGVDGEIALAGRDVTFAVTINYITRSVCPEYNDEFVQTYYSDYDLSTVEDFEEYIYNMIRNNLILSAVWEDYVSACEVVSYDETEVSALVQQILEYYDEMYESSYGYTLEEILELYDMDLETFTTDTVVPAAQDTVKEKMVIRQIASNEKITVTDEIYNREAKLYMVSEDFSSVEEMEEYYGKDAVEFSILYDLVTEWVAEHVNVYDDLGDATEENTAEETTNEEDTADETTQSDAGGEEDASGDSVE